MWSCHLARLQYMKPKRQGIPPACLGLYTGVFEQVLVFLFKKAAELLVCSVCCSPSCSLGYCLLNAVSFTVQANVQHIFVFQHVQKQAIPTPAERHPKVTVRMSVFPSHPAQNSPLTGLLTQELFVRL